MLRKALERGIKIILLINKVDRPDARIEEVEDKVLELFYDLATDDNHVEYTTIYASGKHGWATLKKGEEGQDFSPLLDRILEEIPPPSIDENGPFKMIVVNRSYNSFMGQIAIGRIQSGKVKDGQRVQLMGATKNVPFAVTSLETFAGLGTEKVSELSAGDIALIAGADAPKIGDTIAELGVAEALPRVKVDPPTVAIRISVNTSPLPTKTAPI